MENSSGFYKFSEEAWFFAPHIVEAPNYILLADNRNEYEYPIDGWTWYDEEPIEYTMYKNKLK